MLPLLYIAAVLIGLGALFIIERVSLRLPDLGRPLAIGLVCLPFVFTLPETIRDNNLSSHFLVEDFSDNVLEALPPETVFLTGSDASYFPLAYKHFVEKKRDDIIMIHGDSGGLLLQATPYWKYSILFPDLPVKSPFAELDMSYLMDKTVYAFEPAFLSDDIKAAFKATPYIHSYKLTSSDKAVNDAASEQEFMRAFGTMVYERSLRERSSDMYSAEIKMSMFIPVSHYAFIMKERGDLDASHKYYEDSLKLITPKGLAHYVVYLRNTGRKAEAEAFVEAIEPYAETTPDVRKLSEEIRRQFLQ